MSDKTISDEFTRQVIAAVDRVVGFLNGRSIVQPTPLDLALIDLIWKLPKPPADENRRGRDH